MILARAIKPRELNVGAMRRRLHDALREVEKVVKRDFEMTTDTWKHKPKFKSRFAVEEWGPELEVWTDDEIYTWVNEGTGLHGPRGRSYPIFAGYYTGKSDKKFLVFPSMFTPKTEPGTLKTGYGSSGGGLVHVPFVEHPGIRPRKFDEQIKKLREPWFEAKMRDAMKGAARASGWGG